MNVHHHKTGGYQETRSQPVISDLHYELDSAKGNSQGAVLALIN